MATAEKKPRKKLKPLAISCTSTNCDADLHCFLQKRRKEGRNVGGPCRACGTDLVKWERVQARDISDAAYTFEAQRQELIRHEFWHREIDQDAVNHARRKGRVQFRTAVDKRIRNSVGRDKNPREGQQTPFTGNAIYYAQHALGCCCRRCIDYWHGIEPGRALTDDEVKYFVELVMLFVQKRLPWLRDEPEKVPRRKSKPKKKRA
jgi:hypothetical protein